jgi:ribosomal protein S27AE
MSSEMKCRICENKCENEYVLCKACSKVFPIFPEETRLFFLSGKPIYQMLEDERLKLQKETCMKCSDHVFQIMFEKRIDMHLDYTCPKCGRVWKHDKNGKKE